MSTHLFSIREAIKFGWELTKKHFWLLFGSLLFTVAVQVIPQYIIQFALPVQHAEGFTEFLVKLAILFILGLLFLLINLVLRIGFTKMTIKIARHEHTSFKELFVNYRYMGNFIVASLLYTLVIFLTMIPLFLIMLLLGGGFFLVLDKNDPIFSLVYALVALAGLILALWPAAYYSLKYWYFSYFIVDQNLSPLESLKKSGQATQGVKLKLLAFYLALTLFNIAGFLALGVGLLATIPTSILASTYVYNILSKRV